MSSHRSGPYPLKEEVNEESDHGPAICEPSVPDRTSLSRPSHLRLREDWYWHFASRECSRPVWDKREGYCLECDRPSGTSGRGERHHGGGARDGELQHRRLREQVQCGGRGFYRGRRLCGDEHHFQYAFRWTTRCHVHHYAPFCPRRPRSNVALSTLVLHPGGISHRRQLGMPLCLWDGR